MTERVIVPTGAPLEEYSIGIFNKIKVVFIPVGVKVNLSFKNTPKSNERYPLTDLIEDLDEQGQFVSEPRECFLHLDGTSTEDIILYCSNTSNDSYVNVELIKELRLNESTRLAIEENSFIPNGEASQHTIAVGNITEIITDTLIAIKVYSSAKIGVELNSNGVAFPMDETGDIFLKHISNVKFHNLTTEDVEISILYMGTSNASIIEVEAPTTSDDDYLLTDYINDNYVNNDNATSQEVEIPTTNDDYISDYVNNNYVNNDNTTPQEVETPTTGDDYISDYVEKDYI